MDGLCRAIGAGVPVTLAGCTYLLSPLTLGDFGTIEQLLLSRRILPTDAAAEMFEHFKDPVVRARARERAEKDLRRKKWLTKVDQSESLDWIETTEGIEFTAWLCLRKEHSEFATLEPVKRLLARSEESEVLWFVKLRDQASGLDWFSRMDWPKSREETDRRRPNWHLWVRRVLVEYPGLSHEQLRGWTLNNLRGAFLRLRGQKDSKTMSRASDSGDMGSDDVSESQLRKRSVV